MRQLIAYFCLLILAACAPLVPATTPPQLEHTPGAFVVVTDSIFDAGTFVVDYPSSWRVVKSSIAATETMQVVFVAPDESTITLTEVTSADDSNPDEQFIPLSNDVVVQVLIQPSDDPDEQFTDIADHVVDSIRASD